MSESTKDHNPQSSANASATNLAPTPHAALRGRHIPQKTELGDVRPSQAMTTYGIGSLVDLPRLSALVMGLDDWRVEKANEIGEPRLLQSVQNILGPQITKLSAPPRPPETQNGRSDGFNTIGIPVASFPRWLVCSRCRRLGRISSNLFELKTDPFRPDRAHYVHSNCNTSGRQPVALPARFLVACVHGHLDDFPWEEYVHRGPSTCQGGLEIREHGVTGEASDVVVKCLTCEKTRHMAEAFGRDNRQNLPPCRGRRPHLRDFEPGGCTEPVRAIMQGASNSWFPVLVSAMSLPQSTDRIAQLIDENWVILGKARSQQNVELFRQIGQLKDLSEFSDAQIWDAVEKKNSGQADSQTPVTADLKPPEWAVFSNPGRHSESRDFKLTPVHPPEEYRPYFSKIVLAEKLREVKAL